MEVLWTPMHRYQLLALLQRLARPSSSEGSDTVLIEIALGSPSCAGDEGDWNRHSNFSGLGRDEPTTPLFLLPGNPTKLIASPFTTRC